MKLLPLALAPLVAVAALPAPLLAQASAPPTQPAPPEAQAAGPLEAAAEGVVAVLRQERPAADVFAPSFRAAVPDEQLAQLMQRLVAQFGALQGVEAVTATGPASATIALRFERAIGSGPMQIDAQGKVAGLLLNQFDPLDDGADRIVADLAALPGTTSLYYAPLGEGAEPIMAVNADTQMAIGSTFKLYVLSALARQVERGERAWDEVVRLDRRSLPSGIAQAWPEGAPVTIHTLATLMISISDNTATDQLVAVVGRDAIAAELRASGHAAPERTLPFLTTLELFGLKGDIEHGLAYARASEEEQERMLDAFATEIAGDPERIVKPTFTAPTAIDSLEWFASGRDLARLLGRIAALDDPTAREIMAVNPSMPDIRRADWRYAGYKGGSEPGVLNLTWLLQGDDGEWRILTLGWNDPTAPVETSALELIAQRALSLGRDAPGPASPAG